MNAQLEESARYVAPAMDGLYCQWEDRPAKADSLKLHRYLYWDKLREQRN